MPQNSRSKPHIVILGAGISGLALGYYLKKAHGDKIVLSLLEKESHVGGWVQTSFKDGFMFERGPRGFRKMGSDATCALIEDLHLSDELLLPSEEVNKRYLFESKSLKLMPRSFIEVMRSSFLKLLLKAVVKDIFYSKKRNSRECDHSHISVAEFFTRHFGSQFTDVFIDALVLGIYAGNMHALSMEACFPKIFEIAREHGSLIRGMLFKKRKPVVITSPVLNKIASSPLVSFKNGMQTLPRSLAAFLGKSIRTECIVESLNCSLGNMSVQLQGGEVLKADILCSALPADILAEYLDGCSFADETFQSAVSCLKEIPYQDLDVVFLGFDKKILRKKGFGYLVPSKENQAIIGVIWDSEIFPEHQSFEGETRLTVMMKSGCKDPAEEALLGLKYHLGIESAPKCVIVQKARIPQYTLGHIQRVKTIEESLKHINSNIHIIGNSFYGVSVNDCIRRAKIVAENITNQLYTDAY